MGKATMVNINVAMLKKVLESKKLPVAEMAMRLGHSDSWGFDMMRTGRCKKTVVCAIANMLGVSEDILLKNDPAEEKAYAVDSPFNTIKHAVDAVSKSLSDVDKVIEALRNLLEAMNS